ncbi:MAG: PglZ domain-containing protein [Armatimonadota bacterium]
MTWIRYIINDLTPAFGGIPTFCEDPDGLLQTPVVREALRQAGMTIIDWDGSWDRLALLEALADDDKPLLIVPDGSLRHLIESRFPDHHWESISVGEIFSKFPHDLVKSIPQRYWDRLYRLQEQIRRPLSQTEAAETIARAIYGIDPLYLAINDGWVRTLAEVALSTEGLPIPLAMALHQHLASSVGLQMTADVLADPPMARSALLTIMREAPTRLGQLPPASQVLLDRVRQEGRREEPGSWTGAGAFTESLSEDASASECLAFGLKYGEASAMGKLQQDDKLVANHAFTGWVQKNYGTVLSSLNPDVLKITSLVKTFDARYADDRLLFLMVDCLSLPAWHAVEAVWRQDGVIGKQTTTRAAFAIIPTLTSLSRRAFFEGKPPAQFDANKPSARYERILWQQRFSHDGEYLSVDERSGLLDAFALGRKRICVVDTSWDDCCHALDPRFSTIRETATAWATRTELRGLMQAAHQHGYRIVLTADHGHVRCEGIGRAQAGDLTEERSKRVLLFNNQALSQQYAGEHTMAYQPAGLPQTCWPVFAEDFAAFEQAGVSCVSHGGMSIEEVFVPVVEVMPV